MHVDTGHNFPEVLEFRDRRVAELGVRLVVASVQESIDAGRVTEETGRARQPEPAADRRPCSTRSRSTGSTRCSAARAGTRRRPGPRSGSSRSATSSASGTPRTSGPELWNLYNTRHPPRRAHPRVPAVQLDRARRLALHRAGAAGHPVHLLRARAAGVRAGRHAAGRQRLHHRAATTSRCSRATVRYRTVGDMTCTGAVVHVGHGGTR